MDKPPETARYLLPRLGELLFVALFVTCILLGPQMMNIDGDVGRHITIGAYILDERTIPTEDIFSHTMHGTSLTPHEWLAQVVFALFHQLGGWDGVIWFSALLIAGTFWVVYRQAQRFSHQVILPLLITALSAAASSLHWLTRPHLFTFLFTALWIWQLETLRRGEHDRWWLFPVLMLIWANTHGAFIMGFALWAMYASGQVLEGQLTVWKEYRPWMYVLVSSCAVSLINPKGMGLWETSLGFLGNQYLVGHTAEYLPPDFHSISTWPFLGLILLSIGGLALDRRRLPFAHLFMLGGTLTMGLISTRNIPLFSIAVAPVLSAVAGRAIENVPALGEWWGKLEDRIKGVEKFLAQGVWSILFVIGFGAALLTGVNLDLGNRGNRFLPEVFPVQAAAWIEEHQPQGRMYNYFPWGGYLLYELWPEYKVFIDGQTDFYGERLTREYECVITGCSRWEEIMQRYQVAWVVLPEDAPLVTLLQGQGDWRLVYSDQTAVILTRIVGDG